MVAGQLREKGCGRRIPRKSRKTGQRGVGKAGACRKGAKKPRAVRLAGQLSMVETRIQAALAMRSSLSMESLLRVIENGLEPQVARAVAGLVEGLIPGFLGRAK